MLICNKRRYCDKKEGCPHAVKHFRTKDCSSMDCPNSDMWGRRCKTAGSSQRRILEKARSQNTKHSIKLSTKDAEMTLKRLHDLVRVEARMSGLHVSDNKKYEYACFIRGIETHVRGLTKEITRAILPEYLSSNKNIRREQVMQILLTETRRQEDKHHKRSYNRPNVITERDQEWAIEHRVNNVQRHQSKIVSDALRTYHFGTNGRSHFYSYFLRSNEMQDVKAELCIYRRGKEMSLQIQCPLSFVSREIENHLVFCRYEDKTSDNFFGFVVIGGGFFSKVVTTEIKGGKFVDPFFNAFKQEGTSKMVIPKKLAEKAKMYNTDPWELLKRKK